LSNRKRRIGTTIIWALALLFATTRFTSAQAIANNDATPFHIDNYHPLEIGAIVQGGFGLTENRNGFKFLMAGVHVGKVLVASHGHSAFRSNFELAGEAFPFWQSYTPKFQRAFCTNPPGTPPQCSPLYTVGGTFTGMSITPVIFRWNLAGTKHFSFWGQAAGGLLWTNHKYPAFGGPPYNSQNDGPNADASVWNFTPQGGVGVHYFVHPRRSIDFGANGIHISSASLGDRNPGVNASVQFSLGYTWWK
jgi:lipid A 3-O-deacylase